MSIEQNIENLEIRNANVVTFVGTSSTMVDTISGRIQCKGFQHNSNVITDVSGPHGRGAAVLKKYPEIIFESGKFDANDSTNTYVQAGYTVTASSQDYRSSRSPWGAFDNNDLTHHEFNAAVHLYDGGNGENPGFATTNAAETTNIDGSGTYRGEWLQIEVPNKIKLNKYVLGKRANNIAGIMPKEAKILGSNDGTNWTTVYDHNDTGGVYSTSLTVVEKRTFEVNSSSFYKYFRLATNKLFETGLNNDNTMTPNIAEWSLYGYEEDPPAGDHSVDTTFKSRFNNPQLTGVQVFVDGKGSGSNQIAGGPVVTDTGVTYDETGKYWNLTGELTSNISVEANTFLEGDQPHAVSMWFNSSNLEANVSNTCVFSVSDQEKLDSVNLDLQSNTWHNLTYAYQGEGGSRVTYLDGQKVSEDQAEDTFGDYPPFAMTGYSQGGYVVMDSSATPSGREGWKVFDDINDSTNANYWNPNHGTTDHQYGGADGIYVGINSFQANSDSTPVGGEWLKVEFPYKFKLNNLVVQGRHSYTGAPGSGEQNPIGFRIIGSNDDINWYILKTVTNQTGSQDPGTNNTIDTHHPAYKYYVFHVTHNAGSIAMTVGGLQFYGHRENDLVRLPDPTHVLKYPHIAMTGPAQRGYVASESSKVNNNNQYGAWGAFNGNVEEGTSEGWASEFDTYNNANPSLAVTSGSLATQFNSRYGEYINIKLPHKILLSKIHTFPRTGNENPPIVRTYEHPDAGYLYGSNDGFSTFQEIYSFDGVTVSSTYNVPVIHTIPSSHLGVNLIAYDEYRFQITRLKGQNRFAIVSEMELFGTEEATPVPIQIGGGNIDKVANFRVYDKFVGEDQALEIWNAQKDEFGRAKPQMVLQQGKLGIGTDAPQGSLSVADEPDPDTYGLQEFPPKPLAGYKTHFEGHGVFCASASNEHQTNVAWEAFDKSNDNGRHYQHAIGSGGGYSTSDGSYGGSVRLSPSSGTPLGVYLALKMPYKIHLKQFSIQPRNNAGYLSEQTPKDGQVWGSNDGDSWYHVHSYTGLTFTSGTDTVYFNVNHTNAYSRYALIVTKSGGGTNSFEGFSIGELRYFGYREQVTKQSILHDGQLTLTKNLNVPRIGPDLDADDTPRRDRLVVEYNTSTNPTFEGGVRDTSGRGNDGVFYGGASYDATQKALVFDGTTSDQFVHTLKNGRSEYGNIDYSVSLWFNPTTVNISRWRAVFAIGVLDRTQPTDNDGDEISMYVRSGGNVLHLQNGGSSFETTDTLTPGEWVHIVLTYDGVYRKIYLDGSLSVSHGYSALNLPKEMLIRLAQSIPNNGESDEYMDCKISNFKAWFGAALTASEVKTLYDMGRCDEGHHVVNFSKTRVGIGLGDGEAPTYTLDVRGQIRSQGSLVTSFTGQHKCVPEEPVEKGLIVSAKKNKFVKLNGGLDTGKGAITIDESLPVVSLSSVAKDKACFGVVSSMEEANTTLRTETTDGGVISIIPKTLGDNRAIVNSVGEGAIWIVDTNGPLESGDYITTSNVPGYGQKQDGAGLMNYTVAKITMDCDFTATEVPVQVIKREETGLRTITEDTWNGLIDYERSSNTETQYSNTLVPSAYLNLESDEQLGYVPREVITIIDYTDGSNTISVSEWSNLIPETQNTYQSNTFTEIADYTKFVSTTEWSNFTTDVQNTYSEAEITTYYQIQRGDNVLDENGQLQWEDKTGATEAPYERRFITADGTQTDEANAVHIAAFVGCTYHCG